MQDAELVGRCADGEPAAWDDLVRLHAGLLYSVAAKVLGGPDVEDVVQAVFTKLWEDGRRRLRTFEGRSRLSTWLVVLVRREALDRVRARDARRLIVGGVSEGAGLAAAGRNGKVAITPADAFASREEQQRLLDGVDALPPRDRLLVRLVYLDGHAYGDVARLLAVPENSISPWLARARDRLRTALGGSLYGSEAREPLKGRSESP